MSEENPSQFVEVNGEFIKRIDAHMGIEDERALAIEKVEKQRKGWHIGKEIPLAVIGALILQTVGVIWLSAVTVTKVDLMKETASMDKAQQIIINQRQDDDSRRSEDRILTRLDKVDTKLDRLIERK